VAVRWGKQGIRSNVIAPGFIMTAAAAALVPESEKAEILKAIPSTRHGKAEDIAAMVAMLASDDGQWINGQILSVDGGITMR
jgi:NAD(P)-dependent dehydrogenase (short-subunit alcohol dehydrogenase family)